MWVKMVLVWDLNSRKKTRTQTTSSENNVFSEQGSTLSTRRSCHLYAFWELEGFHDLNRNLHLKTDSATDTAVMLHLFLFPDFPPLSLTLSKEKILVSLTLLEAIATGNQITPSPLPWVNNWCSLGLKIEKISTQLNKLQNKGLMDLGPF